jgi:putative membrane protein
MPLRHLAITAAGGLLLAAAPFSPLHAQAKPATKATPTHATTSKDSMEVDARFVREAAADNLLEVRLGDLAERKATKPSVKQFAQRMVTDHQKLEDQWTDMAANHGIPFKPGLSERHERKLDRLQHTDQKAFDREYMTAVIGDHMDDVDYFRHRGETAHTEHVRKLVRYELPILQDHLMSARQVGKEVGVDSAAVARIRHVARAR